MSLFLFYIFEIVPHWIFYLKIINYIQRLLECFEVELPVSIGPRTRPSARECFGSQATCGCSCCDPPFWTKEYDNGRRAIGLPSAISAGTGETDPCDGRGDQLRCHTGYARDTSRRVRTNGRASGKFGRPRALPGRKTANSRETGNPFRCKTG
jgi:hypothetical protein